MSDTKKKFLLPVSYTVSGYIRIEADNPEQAIQLAADNIDKLPTVPSPEYVSDSYSIETDPDTVQLMTDLFSHGTPMPKNMTDVNL